MVRNKDKSHNTIPHPFFFFFSQAQLNFFIPNSSISYLRLHIFFFSSTFQEGQEAQYNFEDPAVSESPRLHR